MLYSCRTALFLGIVVDLVVFALFVLALLHVVAVAVDDDLDFFVEADDALVRALLLLKGVLRNGETVIYFCRMLLLIILFIAFETLDHLRLFDYLVGEVFDVEGILLLEELQ